MLQSGHSAESLAPAVRDVVRVDTALVPLCEQFHFDGGFCNDKWAIELMPDWMKLTGAARVCVKVLKRGSFQCVMLELLSPIVMDSHKPT